MPVGDLDDCMVYWNQKAIKERESFEAAKQQSARERLLAGVPGAMSRINNRK